MRDLQRGYSDGEILDQRRILAGNVTPDDRLRYRSGELGRLSRLLSTNAVFYSATGDFTTRLAVPAPLALLEQVRAVDKLPDDFVDQHLIEQARQKLESWHQSPHEVHVSPSQRLWDNKVFRLLKSIRLDHTIYPFTLKGEDYLNSGWKRGLDVGVGLLGTALFALPIGLGAIAIKINVPDKNPFITRYRYGLNNDRFNMYKIRSQSIDTSNNGIVDPVAVGRILRVTSIDEFPQVLNLLSGQMSAVGRRPTLPIDYQNVEKLFLGEIPYQRAKRHLGFTDEQWNSGLLDEEFRSRVVSYADQVRVVTRPIYEKYVANDRAKPGATGLYQVLGRKNIPLKDRVKLELAYERVASLGLDLAILAATPWAVLRRKGAR